MLILYPISTVFGYRASLHLTVCVSLRARNEQICNDNAPWAIMKFRTYEL